MEFIKRETIVLYGTDDVVDGAPVAADTRSLGLRSGSPWRVVELAVA